MFESDYIYLLIVFLFKAYKTSWGFRCPGARRGKLLNKLADLIEEHIDEFAALEALDVGMFNCFLGSLISNRYTLVFHH